MPGLVRCVTLFQIRPSLHFLCAIVPCLIFAGRQRPQLGIIGRDLDPDTISNALDRDVFGMRSVEVGQRVARVRIFDFCDFQLFKGVTEQILRRGDFRFHDLRLEKKAHASCLPNFADIGKESVKSG
jgi:hypothetical protein